MLVQKFRVKEENKMEITKYLDLNDNDITTCVTYG